MAPGVASNAEVGRFGAALHPLSEFTHNYLCAVSLVDVGPCVLYLQFSAVVASWCGCMLTRLLDSASAARSPLRDLCSYDPMCCLHLRYALCGPRTCDPHRLVGHESTPICKFCVHCILQARLHSARLPVRHGVTMLADMGTCFEGVQTSRPTVFPLVAFVVRFAPHHFVLGYKVRMRCCRK